MDGEIVVTECRSCQSLRPWWFPPITPPIRAPEPRFSPSTPVENVKSWGCYLVGVFCNKELSELPSDKPFEGETPDDKPGDYERLGRPGKKSPPKRNKEDGSVWEADKDGHAGSKWKRWPSVRDWEKDRGKQSIRPDGSVRK